MRDDSNCFNWYEEYREDFIETRINKSGLTSILSHAVNKYNFSVDNYITYGLRDHYVR